MGMLILLPPSEGKAQPAKGKPIELARLSFPSLTDERARLLDDELRVAPTLPASRLYTGVLYAALDLPSLPASIANRFVIISAQFGAVRPKDRIPSYKRVIEAARWRPLLAPELERAAGKGVILDCRSATYVAAWRPGARESECLLFMCPPLGGGRRERRGAPIAHPPPLFLKVCCLQCC